MTDIGILFEIVVIHVLLENIHHVKRKMMMEEVHHEDEVIVVVQIQV